MKPYLIRITCPGFAPVKFEGLFRNSCDAVIAAMDRAPSERCAVYVKRLETATHTTEARS